jgi:hypothetical protein
MFAPVAVADGFVFAATGADNLYALGHSVDDHAESVGRAVAETGIGVIFLEMKPKSNIGRCMRTNRWGHSRAG